MAAWRGALGLGLLLLCLLPVPGERGAAAEGGPLAAGLPAPAAGRRSEPAEERLRGGDREKGEGGSVPGAASPSTPSFDGACRRAVVAGMCREAGRGTGGREGQGHGRAFASREYPGKRSGLKHAILGLAWGLEETKARVEALQMSEAVSAGTFAWVIPSHVCESFRKCVKELLDGGQVLCRCSPLLGSEGCNRSADPNTNA